jgi:hypothetical protein
MHVRINPHRCSGALRGCSDEHRLACLNPRATTQCRLPVSLLPPFLEPVVNWQHGVPCKCCNQFMVTRQISDVWWEPHAAQSVRKQNKAIPQPAQVSPLKANPIQPTNNTQYLHSIYTQHLSSVLSLQDCHLLLLPHSSPSNRDPHAHKGLHPASFQPLPTLCEPCQFR